MACAKNYFSGFPICIQIIDIQWIIDAYLEPGILLLTKAGEKVFLNENQLIRNFGYFHHKKAWRGRPFVHFHVVENVCYAKTKLNSTEVKCMKLVEHNWIQSENIVHCAKLECEYNGSLFEYVPFYERMYIKTDEKNLELIGRNYLTNEYPVELIFVFEHKIFLYSLSSWAYFDLETFVFVQLPKPPVKLSTERESVNWIIFNRRFFIIGGQMIQYYDFDQQFWVHKKFSKFPQKIIACLLSDRFKEKK